MAGMQTSARQRILVVDDDPRLRKLLLRFLGSEGFDVDAVLDAAEMERQLERGRYDLLLLDVMLPGENGFSVCRRLRAAGEAMSVIMLSAKGDDVDRVVGLRSGADDYIAKPFNPEELLARIHAVLRRRSPLAPGNVAGEGPIVRFGPFRLNLENRALTKSGELIPLTNGEFSLLKVFAEHLGQPLSREKLAELSRGREHDEQDRSIDVQVSRLRKLLGEDPQKPRLIKTVWGFGYALVPGAARPK
jgi:two-component system, OmpR family, phosphate regulon response regulator OmpR